MTRGKHVIPTSVSEDPWRVQSKVRMNTDPLSSPPPRDTPAGTVTPN
jgi:hypothetical protein